MQAYVSQTKTVLSTIMPACLLLFSPRHLKKKKKKKHNVPQKKKPHYPG